LRGLSILASIVVVMINTALRRVVRIFSQMEKHETYTDYNLSVAFKLILARFVNTSIVPLIANLAISKWFEDGGLVSVIFYVMLSISFVDPLMNYFDVWYVIRHFRRWNARRQGNACVLT
jgi:hypothetical protein